jgi:hypothetical protein
MDGACPRCIINNTSVLLPHGSGPDRPRDGAVRPDLWGHLRCPCCRRCQ